MVTTTGKPKRPHVDDQSCGNCAYMRARPNARHSYECRWEGPPWSDKTVTSADWCRRWAPRTDGRLGVAADDGR